MVNAALRLRWLFSPLTPYHYFVPLPRLQRPLEYAQIISRWSNGGPSQYSSPALNLTAWSSFIWCILVASEQWLSAKQLLGDSCLGIVAKWPSHWRWLLDFCEGDPVLLFTPWLSVKEVVAPVHTATDCRFPYSDLFAWPKRCSGWVSHHLGPQLYQLICGLNESFWRQDGVCVARLSFHGCQLVENVERRGRM